MADAPRAKLVECEPARGAAPAAHLQRSPEGDGYLRSHARRSARVACVARVACGRAPGGDCAVPLPQALERLLGALAMQEGAPGSWREGEACIGGKRKRSTGRPSLWLAGWRRKQAVVQRLAAAHGRDADGHHRTGVAQQAHEGQKVLAVESCEGSEQANAQMVEMVGGEGVVVCE